MTQFYQLTLEDAIAHRDQGIISDSTLVFYLFKIRFKEGWMINIDKFKEFCLGYDISIHQFYRGLKKIQKVFTEFKCTKITVASIPQSNTALNAEPVAESAELIAESAEPVAENANSLAESAEPVAKNANPTPVEPLPNKQPSDSPDKNSDSYSNFVSSLSQSEREKFLDFVKEKTKNLNQPINDIEAWLAVKNSAGIYRFRVYYDMFKNEIQTTAPEEIDWRSEPDFEELRESCDRNWAEFIISSKNPTEKNRRLAFVTWWTEGGQK